MTRVPSILLAAVVCGLAVGAPAARPESPPEPALGAYRGALATAGVDAFAAWLGRDVVWAEDNTGPESWNNVADPVWWMSGWSKWKKEKEGRRLVLGIPMLPGPLDLTGPTQGDVDVGKPVSLERGAEGLYDAHFARLAKGLVAHGLADTVLRPGWEFNGDWYAWRAKGKADAFAAYWRRIVRAMRAVPGTERLHFCWNPTVGDVAMPAETAWPGDEFVDSIGLDVYDVSWIADTYPWPAGTSSREIEERRTRAWEQWIEKASRGLRFWVKFATDHGKPLSIPEWGCADGPDGRGGGDDAAFVDRMHAFVTDPGNRVAFHCTFDSEAPDGHHRLSPGTGTEGKSAFPAAAERFRDLWGPKGDLWGRKRR